MQGKGERISYKVKKSVPKKREDWIRVPNCHEAIVTKEEYYMVQQLLHIPTRARKNTEKAHSLAGLLFCADCKKPLIRRKNCYKGQEKIFYICSTKNKGLGCSRHSIEEKVLLNYMDRIRDIYLDRSIDRNINKNIDKNIDKNIEQISQNVVEEIRPQDWDLQLEISDHIIEKELEKLKEYKESYKRLCFHLEENVAEGILTKEEAISLFSIYKEQEKKIEEAIVQQSNFEWEDCLEEYLWRKQNFLIVDRIEVEKDKKVVFILKNGERYQFDKE